MLSPSKLSPLFVFIGCLLRTLPIFAQDVDDPASEASSFQLPPGFQVNLFASEAEGVVKPIQMRWDARGRLWVICSTAYPLIKPGEDPHDQVLILEDTDRDGHADKTTVFDDQLLIPTGLELDPDGHGAWVGEGTKLWHLRDTDGNDTADSREVVLRGFGTGDNHQNLNSFRWSPGGDLFFCQGLHAFSRVETPRGTVGLDEAGFWRLRPRSLELEGFYGGKQEPQNPWGWVWTEWGQPLMVAGNNGGIYYPLPDMVRGHDESRAANIWVNPRTRKSSGPDIIGTAHLPPEWQGVFLTGGYMNNAVWALQLEEDGAGFRLTDKPPLVTSSHASFRTVDVKVGPDGAIYLCDWYNPIIGHYQASFRHPGRDKSHGRIWRISAKDRPLVQQPPISGASIAQLLENLCSPERWARYESKRALLAQPPAEVVPALGKWIAERQESNAGTEHALFEALGIYEALDLPTSEVLNRLLRAQTPDARAYAAGVVARWGERVGDPIALLHPLVADPHPRVRLAAVVALANLAKPKSLTELLGVASQPTDRFLDAALHQAVHGLKPLWQPALAAGTLQLQPAQVPLLIKADGTADTVALLRQGLANRELDATHREPLLLGLAQVGEPADLATLLDDNSYVASGTVDRPLQARIFGALVDAGRPLAAADAERGLRRFLQNLDDETNPLVRREALRLAGTWKVAALAPFLVQSTDETGSRELRLAGVEGLSRLGGKNSAVRLIELADDRAMEIRIAAVAGLASIDVAEAARQAVGNVLAAEGTPEAVAVLLPAFLQRQDGAQALAKELREQSPAPRPALAASALQTLRAMGRAEPELTTVLEKIAGGGGSAMKATPEVVQALAAETVANGDAAHGAEVFRRAELACTACHAVAGAGGNIGPALDSIGSGQPLDFIIGAVLEPQREIKESFEAVEVVTRDGQVVQGYRTREANGGLTLRDVSRGVETTFTPEQIASKRELGSLMPPGLLDRLSREDQRDLFRYLSELGKPREAASK